MRFEVGPFLFPERPSIGTFGLYNRSFCTFSKSSAFLLLDFLGSFPFLRVQTTMNGQACVSICAVVCFRPSRYHFSSCVYLCLADGLKYLFTPAVILYSPLNVL